MKKKVALLVVIALGIVAISYVNFEKDRKAQYCTELRTLYLEKKEIIGSVRSVLFIDSILSVNLKYRRLKQAQYAEWIRAGNFNTPPSEKVKSEVMNLVNSSLENELHRTFIISIFRMSVMFKIVDELKNPTLPTKQQIADDFTDMI